MTRLILWAYSLLEWVFWIGTDSIDIVLQNTPQFEEADGCRLQIVGKTSRVLQCRRCQLLTVAFFDFFPHCSIHSEMSAITHSYKYAPDQPRFARNQFRSELGPTHASLRSKLPSSLLVRAPP